MSIMYFPEPESRGTFRYARTDEKKSELCGFDPEKLRYTRHYQYFLNSGSSFGVVILRNEWMADEYYTENVLSNSSFDIWSCTKSFTSMAYAILIGEEENVVSYQERLYDHLPDEFRPNDERRLEITFEQLLDMTSGLRGAGNGSIGMGVPYGEGEFEYALGFSPNRNGLNCDLLKNPDSNYDYSDANYTLLALAFYYLTSEDIRDFINRKLFELIGVESAHWDMQGGYGKIGPFTNGHTGLHISTRDLARVGYLLLNNGIWDGKRILPELFFRQLWQKNKINQNYRNGFWMNTKERQIPSVPEDAYFMKGYRSNRCYIIPSLNLVVVRCGTGPAQWDEGKMLGDIVSSIT